MSTATAHRRLAAIMFTDMVGYSALSQRNESLALELLEEHRRIVRHILPGHGGREVKTTGVGFLIEFPSALAAVQCAVAIQDAIRERNQVSPPEREVEIRIGIHVGDVVLSEGDVHGDGVDIAARIEPLAEPGGICVTRAVFEQMDNKLPQKFIRLSAPELKNISANVEVYRLVAGAAAGDSATAARSRKLLYWLVLGIVVLNVVLFAKYGLSERKADRAGQSPATNARPTVSVATTNVDIHSPRGAGVREPERGQGQ